MTWLSSLAAGERLGEARATLARPGLVSLSGLTGPARALLALLLGEAPLLVVVPRERDVEEVAQDLQTLAREADLAGPVLPFPAPGPSPFRGLPRHADASLRRATALQAAVRGSLRALVASPAGLLRPSLAPRLLETSVVHLRVGEEMTPEILLEALDEGGYRREDPVSGPGQVARRGGILDVFPPDRETPVRLEFLGDTLEDLRSFDPETQRGIAPLEELTLLPLSDVFLTRSTLAALRDLLPRRLGDGREVEGLLESFDRGLVPEDLVELNPGAPDAQGNRAVIAAGTGLGEGGLYWDGKAHHPFAAEGGHADFAPHDELEMDLLRFLLEETEHVSWERLVSGMGLGNIYRFLRETGREEEPAWLAEAMREGDPGPLISKFAREGRSRLCERTLDVFVSLYGAEAGNLALKVMSSGGLYVGGGIAPKNLDKMRDGTFVKAFLAKGRMRPLLEAMPVRMILTDDTGLLGAAHCAALRAGRA